MSPRKPYLFATALWLAMVVVFFWPVFFQGKVLAPLDIMDSLLRPWAHQEKIEVHNAFTYDAISQYLPYDWSVYQSLRQDGYIGWNPYTHSGSSIVENTMICPGDWHHHLYRFLPFWTAWNAGIIMQFALAGLGMLLLLRDQKIPAFYALIGVCAFGFYSQFTLWIFHRWVLGAMCWSPWILWSLLRARRAGRIIDLPAIAFIALAFRGGHLQSCLTIVLMVVLIAFADWWQDPEKLKFRQVIRLLTPYAISGILGSVLVLDVFVETIPTLSHGCKTMAERPWSETLQALPTLASSIIPTLTGTPQGLDASKFFHTALFTIKFMGAIALFLAFAGCISRKGPMAAKVLMLAGLVLPFTPADKWLYSRFTSVFALGAAWLAAWYLHDLPTRPRNPLLWKRTFLALAITTGCWLLASIVIHWNQPLLTARLDALVTAELTADKSSRLDWMFARGRVFLETLKIWHPFNLALLACITTGLIAASRIHMDGVRLHLLATLAALCTFGELFLFSRTWITFSAPPNGQGLYENTEWMMRLKKETGPGTILCYDRSEFDYLQLNTPSVYGLRFAEGYETVTPKRINPYADDLFDPARCASAGISHLLVAPGKDPGEVPGWEKTITSKKFVLYRNPQFTGICHAGLLNGETLPLVPRFQSPNRREIPLPENTKTVTLLESFNPGWKYSTDGESWLPVLESPLHGIRVELENPTITESARLLLQYRPVYQPYYRGIMTTTALGLLGFSIYRRQKQRQYLKRKPCAQAPPPLALLAFVQGIFRDARGRDVHAP